MSEPPWIPLSEPALRGNEWRYVKDCLDSGWVSSAGAFVERFERETAARLGTAHAVACASGTAALHLALQAAGVGPGDAVLVPTLTFVAPANAVRYLGATPVFIDVDPDYWQMDPERTADFLAKKSPGLRVRAILPVHVLGHPADLDPLLETASRHGLETIEDATESLGARYKGKSPGSLGRAGCLSFNGNKIVTTGGGGMVATNDGALAARAKYLSTQAKDDPVEYVHGAVGYNYRLVNVLAALGCAQLEQLDGHVAAKRRIAARYDAALADVPGLRTPRRASWAESSEWLYSVLVDAGRYGEDSRALLRRLAAHRIQARPLWQPLHLSPAHRGAAVVGGETAERLYRDALSLPCSVGLTEEQQDAVVRVMRERPR
jgi:perosamine synthetase